MPGSTPAARAATAVRSPLSWPAVVGLHLFPGAALTLTHLLGAPLLRAAGLPTIWALLAGVLLVVVPIEGGLVLRHRRRHGSEEPLPGRGSLGRGSLALATLATVAVSVLLSGAVLGAEAPLRALLDSVALTGPPTGPGDVAALSPGPRAVTLALWVLAAVVVGPLVEEAYFRAWLQPRIPARPVPAAFIGAALFATYHFWQPATWLTVLAFALPVAVLVARTRATAAGALVQVAVNAVAFVGLLTSAFSR